VDLECVVRRATFLLLSLSIFLSRHLLPPANYEEFLPNKSNRWYKYVDIQAIFLLLFVKIDRDNPLRRAASPPFPDIMFEINISHKSARIRCITLKSRMVTRRLAAIASAFLLALITYSCVLPVDHPLSVRALAPRAAARRAGKLQLKMHASGTNAPRGCASSQKKGGGQREREVGGKKRDARDAERWRRRRRQRERRRRQRRRLESHLRLNFKFSPTNERFSDDGTQARGAGREQS